MNFEAFAREKLIRDLPGFRKNGLKHWLGVINKVHWLEGIDKGSPGFIPDGTRLRRQPPHNDKYIAQDEWDKWDITLELWEIEDTSKINVVKMERIQGMAHGLFDMANVFTEIWVCTRYGTRQEKVWDVRDELGPGEWRYHEPHEWMQGDEWVMGSKQF